MNDQDFTSYFKTKELLKLYFSLTPMDKNILHRYGAQKVENSSLGRQNEEGFSSKNLCQYLWVSAANVIPQGHYFLAEKLLYKALEMTDNDLDKAHIHSNLAQVYADQNKLAECCFHCKKTIDTEFFIPWAKNLLKRCSEKEKNL